MGVKLGNTIVVDYETHDPTSGTAAAPDSTSVKVFENTTAASMHSPTPDVRTGLTGANFVEIPVTAGNGYEVGKSYNVYATAVFSAITRHKVIASFVVTAQETDDLATPADVNAQVVDALATDAYAEPGQGAPAATTNLAAKIGYLYKFLRNRITQDATTLSIFADDATTVDQKATVSDDGTTYDRGEIGSGP